MKFKGAIFPYYSVYLSHAEYACIPNKSLFGKGLSDYLDLLREGKHCK